MKKVIVKVLVSAGLGVACGLVCKKINNEMEKWTLTQINNRYERELNNPIRKEDLEQMKKDLDFMNNFAIKYLQKDQRERIVIKAKEVVERQKYIEENMELVRIHGLEKAEQIRWEQMNQPKED